MVTSLPSIPRHLRARRLRLPGARALGAVAALPGAPAGAGHHLRPHRRVRLVAGSSRARASSTGHWLDDAVEALADAERLSRDVHADGDPAGLADPQAPGDPAGRRRRATSATSARASTTTTPARSTASTPAASPARSPSATGSIRPSPAGRPTTSGAATARPAPTAAPAAIAFRVWLEAALRHARGAERGLGQRLLEPGVHRLGPDRPTQPDRGRAEPLARARLLPLRQRRGRRVPGRSRSRSCAELSPGRWITHNYMMHFNEFDHYTNAELLDFASWDSYPLGQVERCLARRGEGALGADRAPRPISFNHDLYRGLKGRRAFWVMEQGAGQVNWAPSNCTPGGGRGRALDRAGLRPRRDFVSYFRWRAATVAQELMHSGSAPPRRDARPRRRGGRRARAERPAERRRAAPGRPPPRLREPLDLRRAAAQRGRELLAPDDALLRRAALARRRRRHPPPGPRPQRLRLIVAPALQLMGEERARHLAELRAAAPSRLRSAHRLPHPDRPRARRRPARSAARPARPAPAQLRRHAPRARRPGRRRTRSRPGPRATSPPAAR